MLYQIMCFGLGMLAAGLLQAGIALWPCIRHHWQERDLTCIFIGHSFTDWSVNEKDGIRLRMCKRCCMTLGRLCDHEWEQDDFVWRAECSACGAQKKTTS